MSAQTALRQNDAGDAHPSETMALKMEEFHRLPKHSKNVTHEVDWSTDLEATPTPHSLTFREKVGNVIHSHKFHLVIIGLVILDCLLVIAELLVEQAVFGEEAKHHVASRVLHYTSITILGLFIIEILVRLYVMRLKFFKEKLEMLDAAIVITSFVLDIVYRDAEGPSSGLGLLILLRLWRVLRIMNGITMTVKKQAERKIGHERHLRLKAEEDVSKLHQFCLDQELEIEVLRELLRRHAIEFVVKTRTLPTLHTIHPTNENHHHHEQE